MGVFFYNAAINKTPKVKKAAERLKIELIFNLPYHPDYNGIELFWGVAKKQLRKQITSFRANHQIYDSDALAQHY